MKMSWGNCSVKMSSPYGDFHDEREGTAPGRPGPSRWTCFLVIHGNSGGEMLFVNGSHVRRPAWDGAAGRIGLVLLAGGNPPPRAEQGRAAVNTARPKPGA